MKTGLIAMPTHAPVSLFGGRFHCWVRFSNKEKFAFFELLAEGLDYSLYRKSSKHKTAPFKTKELMQSGNFTHEA